MKTRSMSTRFARLGSWLALAWAAAACSSTPDRIWGGTDCREHSNREIASADERKLASALDACEVERSTRSQERIWRWQEARP